MRRSTPLVLALLFAAAPARAQQRAALDPQVRLGQRVRIRPQLRPRVEGVLARIDRDSLSLGERDSLHTFALSALDTLWIRRSSARTGALLGAGIGAALVVLACADTLDECGLVPNGVLLAAVLAGLGALIGDALPHWKRVYP